MAALDQPAITAPTTAHRLERLAPAVGVWLLGFAPVLYLGLRGGGFDATVRQQVGVAVWWLVLVGLACGTISARAIFKRGRWVLMVFGLFALWTAASLLWTWS